MLTAGAAYYWTVRTIDHPGAQARGSAEFAHAAVRKKRRHVTT